MLFGAGSDKLLRRGSHPRTYEPISRHLVAIPSGCLCSAWFSLLILFELALMPAYSFFFGASRLRSQSPDYRIQGWYVALPAQQEIPGQYPVKVAVIELAFAVKIAVFKLALASFRVP